MHLWPMAARRRVAAFPWSSIPFFQLYITLQFHLRPTTPHQLRTAILRRGRLQRLSWQRSFRRYAAIRKELTRLSISIELQLKFVCGQFCSPCVSFDGSCRRRYLWRRIGPLQRAFG